MLPTLSPGTMTVASAYPDPPFVVMRNGTATGFEIELMRSVCQELGLTLRPVGYEGDDFNGSERTGPADLRRGHLWHEDYAGKSDMVAKRLLAEGHIADIRYYPYRSIGAALDDLEAGRIGLIIKLFPVLSSLVAERADLAVVMQVPMHEQIGIAYNKNPPTCVTRSMRPSRPCARTAHSLCCRRSGSVNDADPLAPMGTRPAIRCSTCAGTDSRGRRDHSGRRGGG